MRIRNQESSDTGLLDKNIIDFDSFIKSINELFAISGFLVGSKVIFMRFACFKICIL